MHSTSFRQYLEPCAEIASAAGGLIMRCFKGNVATQHKADHSPVTEADLAANALIVAALRALTPGIPVIAEEDDPPSSRCDFGAMGAVFWLVDPLDGTRSFVRGEGEFTVNIALVENRRPVLGILYHPPADALYYAAAGQGAYRRLKGKKAAAIGVRTPASDGLVVTRSRSQPSATSQAYLETLCIKEMIACSSAIKFCHVAEGSADIYPRFGRTMEWDTAAGQVILEEAGGRVETLDGTPLTYGKPGFENPPFVACGKSLPRAAP